MKHIHLFEKFINETYFDLEDRDYVLYHATPTSNVKNIKKHGIEPSKPSNLPFSKGWVWLADTKEAAIHHAEMRMEKKGIKDTVTVIVVKLNSKSDDLHKSLAKGVYTSGKILPGHITRTISPL